MHRYGTTCGTGSFTRRRSILVEYSAEYAMSRALSGCECGTLCLSHMNGGALGSVGWERTVALERSPSEASNFSIDVEKRSISSAVWRSEGVFQ